MLLRNRKHKYQDPEPGQEGAPAAGDGGQEGTPPAEDPPPSTEPPANPFGILDPEYVQHLEKNGIKDVQGLIKQHMDAQSYIGNSIRVPGEDAGEDDRKAFYEKLRKHAPDLIPAPNDPESKEKVFQALGKPEKPDEYQVEVPEAMGSQFDDDRLNMFREAAHKHNLTKEQFEGVMKDVLGADAASYENVMAEVEKSKQQLKSEWGQAYDQRVGTVNKLIESTGAPDSLVQMAKNGDLDPSVVKWMYDLTVRMGSDESLNLSVDHGQGSMTPSEANDRLNEILSNREHPYWNASHPDHKNAVDKVIKLGRAASPADANQKVGSPSFSS